MAKAESSELTGTIEQRFHRAWYAGVPFIPTKPTPPPSSPLPSPEQTASWLSVLAFSWLYPVMRAGYTRPLADSDLWQQPDERSARIYGQRILDAFEKRRAVPARAPLLKRVKWTLSLKGPKYVRRMENDWKASYKPSLVLALNDTVFWWLWSAGILRLFADAGQICSPLLVRAIITFAQESHDAMSSGTTPPSIGKGVGLVFGLLALQWAVLFASSHAFYRMFTTGVILRAGLIQVLFGRALRLSNRGMARIGTFLSFPSPFLTLQMCTNDLLQAPPPA